jgi:hypothetical protein
MPKIVGKVADIVDNRTVVLNVGSKKGVMLNMIFQLLDKDGRKIIDPDTHAVIGSLKLPKIQVRVTYVDEEYSIAETYVFEKVNVGGINSLGSYSNLMAPPKYVKRYETFDIESATKENISKEKSLVKIGDIAELIIEKR